MSITGQWIFIQMDIFINDIKEIELKQKVLAIKYYNIRSVLVSEYYILYAFCTFLYFQNPRKCIEIRKFINDSYVPLFNYIRLLH